MIASIARWVDANIFELGREMRLSYLPPLMVYMAAGISGLTGIVGTFFVKDYLGLSAEFLAALGFWAGIPWALKMPLGHLVDLIWRWKGWLVYLGAALIAVSLLTAFGAAPHSAIRAQQGEGPGASTGSVAGGEDTRTQLPDGRWLLIGNAGGPTTAATMWDPQTGTMTPTTSQLQSAREGHSATVLSDGTVLILGGHNGPALVERPVCCRRTAISANYPLAR